MWYMCLHTSILAALAYYYICVMCLCILFFFSKIFFSRIFFILQTELLQRRSRLADSFFLQLFFGGTNFICFVLL
jgi:hypothetical protein